MRNVGSEDKEKPTLPAADHLLTVEEEEAGHKEHVDSA